VSTSRSSHIDLVVDPDSDLCGWLADLEAKLVELIAAKASTWFTSAMSKDEIDYLLVPSCKTQRSTTSLRVTLPSKRYTGQNETVQFFDENKRPIPESELSSDSECISVLEIVGVRFTTTAMRVEINVKQVMVLGVSPSEACLIQEAVATDTIVDGDSHDEDETDERAVASPVSNTEVPADGTDKIVLEVSEDNSSNVVAAGNNESVEVSPSPPVELDKKEGQLPEASQTAVQGISLEEVDDLRPTNEETIGLKEKNEVFQALYEELYRKAREAKKAAIKLYLDAQELQEEHALEAIESSDEEDENEHVLH